MLKLTEYGTSLVEAFLEKCKKNKDYVQFCTNKGDPSLTESLNYYVYEYLAENDLWFDDQAENMEEYAASLIYQNGAEDVITAIRGMYGCPIGDPEGDLNLEIKGFGENRFSVKDLILFIQKECLYETNPRLSKISAYIEKKKNEEKDAINKEEEALASYKEKMSLLKERISLLVETANACLKAGIKIKNFHHSSDIGFIVMNNGIFYIGYGLSIEGCEAIVYTDGQEMGVKRIRDNAVLQPTHTYFEKLFGQYEDFETEFYSYVDKITNE